MNIQMTNLDIFAIFVSIFYCFESKLESLEEID